MTVRCRDHMIDLSERDRQFHQDCRVIDYCPGRVRHWRILPRTIGLRAPVCIHCGSPSPKPVSAAEWREVIAWWAERERRRDGWPRITSAINTYLAEQAAASPEESRTLLKIIDDLRNREARGL